MKLQELLNHLPITRLEGIPDVEVTGIKQNSQDVMPGDIFVCIPGIPGFQVDRHPYAEDAVRAGAVAIVVERAVNVKDVPTIQVPDARHAMAVMASHLYGYPSRDLKLIGVTGTNGKTTTCHMIEAILAYAGFNTGLMGNIGTKIGETLFETDINTQQPPKLQSNLRRMVDAGADFAVMEVTSQGLHMGRVLGCEYRTAVFTNLTQDHLDYHGTMDAYLAAKGLLFSGLGNAFSPDPDKRKYAILNADEEASSMLRSVTAAHVVTYGLGEAALVRAVEIKLTAQGTHFRLISWAGEIPVKLRMVGTFNLYNALAAITVGLTEGIPLKVIQEGLETLAGVPGRMEVVDEGQDYLVLVDYAHTPDGLDKALCAIKEFAEGRIITVFGCGGDRDRGKRPIMGSIAAQYSDYVIVTSDNPRKEDPLRIMADIEGGLCVPEAVQPRVQYELIADRESAINRAIKLAEPGDIVIIAGKGHETYQILHDGTVSFDDREAARDAIKEK